VTIGSGVRRLLGPRLERAVADRYRRLFVDLDALAATVAGLGSFATVIEVGCGEGALLWRVMDRLDASATALGIDIAANPGHGYEGRNDNIEFRQATVAQVVGEGRQFDLVVVSDVLHHVPPGERRALLESCRSLLAPHGTIVVKEWVRRRNIAHLAAYGSDRFISGDRGVQFLNEDEFRVAFTEVFRADGAALLTSYTRPHWNNVVLVTTAP
jgi:2-polyprenyl-6-hydroxyphenyl methylase/3-demethylubiquinone-9 3-methyltransferase